MSPFHPRSLTPRTNEHFGMWSMAWRIVARPCSRIRALQADRRFAVRVQGERWFGATVKAAIAFQCSTTCAQASVLLALRTL